MQRRYAAVMPVTGVTGITGPSSSYKLLGTMSTSREATRRKEEGGGPIEVRGSRRRKRGSRYRKGRERWEGNEEDEDEGADNDEDEGEDFTPSRRCHERGSLWST